MTLVNNYLLASTIYDARSILVNLANTLFNSISMKTTPPKLRRRVLEYPKPVMDSAGGVGRAVRGALMDVDLELSLRTTILLYIIGLSIMCLYFRGTKTMAVECSN